jgi:hypothetical protein
MNSDPLPNCLQRKLLCEMIHNAFVDIRWLGHAEASKQAADLADAFHNIPMEMYGWGSFRWDSFRRGLVRYRETWPGGHDYVKQLDDIRGLAES